MLSGATVMKKMTQKEFNERLIAMAEAKRIFIDSGMTNNISIAFELYQKILADKEMPLQLDSKVQEAHKGPENDSPPQITIPMDVDLEKPSCPDCGKTLTLRQATGDEWQDGYRSCWTCPACKYEGLSEKSPMRWIRELPEKGAEVVEVEGNSKAEDLP
jgi:predicted RNA-binding Zn-ribbon protein involved in translation (DUF1610 family)